MKAWAHDTDFMKQLDSHISTRLHQDLAGSSTFINCAIRQDVASFRNAFNHPEFQRRIQDYPASAVAFPDMFKKLSVTNQCIT